jgi:photosystem II stability/assembly factor-like uncharacterized protein
MCIELSKTCVLLGLLTIAASETFAQTAKPDENQTGPQVTVVEGGESHLPAKLCRKMIIGPGVNQPDPFPGYEGFVGWESPVRLRDGTMLVSFNAGYWHASRPTPLKQSYMDQYQSKYGPVFDVDAPRGGQAMISRSTDNGVTWSKPATMLDTPYDDRHPAITQLSDGTLVCSLFTAASEKGDCEQLDPSKGPRTAVVRSRDGGQTWESDPHRLPLVFLQEATDGPPLELPDKSVLLTSYGRDKELDRWVIGVFRSTDQGAHWELLSKVVADHSLTEASMVRLQDGRLVMITRPEGALSWSTDDGRSWTPPVSFGFKMFAPTLQVLADGTLLCIHGCYHGDLGGGGLRAIFSCDGGATWVAPHKRYGFAVDDTYGYSRSCLMPDGAAYLAYIGTGGHRFEDARNNSIWSIKLRVRPDHSGIELVPVAGG